MKLDTKKWFNETIYPALKNHQPKLTVVFSDGDDERTINAAKKLESQGLFNVILVTDKMAKTENVKEYTELYYELRKHKNITYEQAQECINTKEFYTVVKFLAEKADILITGAKASSRIALKAMLQLLKNKDNSEIISTSFLMVKYNDYYLFADCALNIEPNSDQLSQIADQNIKFYRFLFNKDPKVALLSYSTKKSNSSPKIDAINDAIQKLYQIGYSKAIINETEIQFDAAISERVAKIKGLNNNVAGHADVFIFPSLEAGNIGYKIASYLGGYKAYGTILQNTSHFCSDLSRGCTEEDIFFTTVLLGYCHINKHRNN